MKRKKPTSYVIWVLALVTFVLSVVFWLFVVATRRPVKSFDYTPEEVVTVEVEDYKEVDKATIYIGDCPWGAYFYSIDSCSEDVPFRADTLVIISTDKLIYYGND